MLNITNHLIVSALFSLAGFILAMGLTPLYTFFAYKYEFWKKQKTASVTGEALTVVNKLHAKKIARHIPTMAGVIGVIAVVVLTVLLNLKREQTWLPLAGLAGGAAIGLIDDILNVWGSNRKDAGLRAPVKFAMIIALSGFLAWFFAFKLHFTTVMIPFIGNFEIGYWMVPLFIFAIVATSNAVNISDGLDGLAGGLLSAAFGAFGIIALVQNQHNLAAFCFTVLGALLAYLWFNVYPARFFMGDVGSFAWGTSLGVVAMLTNSLLLLPVIGLIFVIEAGSSAIQIFSKKVFKRKVFISAPIHHHLEATGWEETKITMRFWIIGMVTAFVGIILALAEHKIL
ncbi:MAG: phospho-N-acetylmuramoyl-pentapeptide-transferase [Candidatus Nanogingivalaceae bacterium]|jgi:phospho-N-acetylmuramoyl-pentapeptide-transferase|nr:phospho-N-acetylmuramoyl-pentapeptide-transferase [Candidatus Nanogingivalaceae bacterium]QTI96489.1 MAG: phospho-N-acetylmuramoyl-pentapeptide-transferase [Candidatus Nanogingivalaceae bacterium]QWB91800.1 MAG: phospho-N-acetylmuramoyl-pentapeptide-transferase [Candidatus Nanogingivalaceae bacterium]